MITILPSLSFLRIASTAPTAAAELPIITYFKLFTPLLEYDGSVWTSLDAFRRSSRCSYAKLTLLYGSVPGRCHCAIRTAQYACITAYAFIPVNGYYTILFRKSTRNAALYAKGLMAVPARNGEAYSVFFLDPYSGLDLYIFQGPCHILFICRRKGAVIFAQVTAQAPLFVYIYTLQN